MLDSTSPLRFDQGTAVAFDDSNSGAASNDILALALVTAAGHSPWCKLLFWCGLGNSSGFWGREVPSGNAIKTRDQFELNTVSNLQITRTSDCSEH
jgi:hypothetical protein